MRGRKAEEVLMLEAYCTSGSSPGSSPGIAAPTYRIKFATLTVIRESLSRMTVWHKPRIPIGTLHSRGATHMKRRTYMVSVTIIADLPGTEFPDPRVLSEELMLSLASLGWMVTSVIVSAYVDEGGR
jgi:hypothetical protein